MITICRFRHEWNTNESDGAEVGQACGALIYYHSDHPEDTKRCKSILKEKVESELFGNYDDSPY